MKRYLIYIIFLLIKFHTLAQVQQGYVKTIGRPNIPGVSLEGVTVRISGNINTVISNSHGNFSFPITNKQFRFSRISKKGFELADKDFLNYIHGYSPNAPITLVMVSREELQRERDIIEEQSRSKLMLRFQKQNSALEKKLEQNVLSAKEFKEQLDALQEKFDNTETLVSILADHYARTDYDNIDSTKILINQCIENGELERAQKLIYSKGSLDKRIKELDDTNELLLQAQTKANKLQQDLASDLLQLHKIAISQQKYDSAYIYLEKCYLTDTTKIKNLYDLVNFNYLEYVFHNSEKKERASKHEGYLFNLYNKVQNPEFATLLFSDVYNATAIIEYKLGNFYKLIEEYEKAILYYRKALKDFKDENNDYKNSVYFSLANIYFNQKDYQEAIITCQEAMNHSKNKSFKTEIQILIADIYNIKGDADIALKKYINAEKIYTHICDSINKKIIDLYNFQEFIAIKLQEKGRNKEAIHFYTKAINNAEHYYNFTNNAKDIIPIVMLLENLQDLYASQHKYKQMYEYADKAMHYAQIYMKRFTSASSKLLYAEMLCQKAYINAKLRRTTTVEQELVECLKKSEYSGSIFIDRYTQLTGKIYQTFAINYYNKNLLKEALNSINKAINITPENITLYSNKINILNALDKKEETIAIKEKIHNIEKNTPTKKNNSQTWFL